MKNYKKLPVYITPFNLVIRPTFVGVDIVYMSLRGDDMNYDSDYSVSAKTEKAAINKMLRLLKKHKLI